MILPNRLAVAGIGVLVAAGIIIGPLQRAAANDVWPSFGISVGSYLATFGSDLRLDSNSGRRGTDLSLEDQLDIDSELASIRFDAFWRFLPRHRVEFTYYDISRDGSVQADRNIQFGDSTFQINAGLVSDIDFQVYKAFYGYSVVQTDDWDISAGAGVHVIELKASLTGTLLGQTIVQKETETALAPLPVIGGRAIYAITPELFLRGEAEFFGIDFGTGSGFLADGRVILDWDFGDILGLSLGYNHVETDVELDDTIEVRYGYDALIAALRLTY